MSAFSENLRKYRKRKKLSQAAVSKKLNYGYTAVANYESDRNEPSIDTLIKLAELLDVTVDELVGAKMQTEEKQLLAAFKKLNPIKRRIILALINILVS